MIAAQMPAELKRARADFIIDNDGTLTQLERRVQDVWTRARAATRRTLDGRRDGRQLRRSVCLDSCLPTLTPSRRIDSARFASHADPDSERVVSDIPKDLLYTEDHEYLKPTGDADVVAIGITDYAQGELGDIVFIELPKVGATFNKHDVFGTVEAVKAVSELYSPVTGEVVAVNDRLDKEPALVNTLAVRRRLDDQGPAQGRERAREDGAARRGRVLRRKSAETVGLERERSSGSAYGTQLRRPEARPLDRRARVDSVTRVATRRLAFVLRVRIRRQAGADEVPVAVGALHPPHRRPELVLARPRRRERGLLAPVRVRPRVADDARQRVRRVLERVVVAVRDSRLDLPDLLADRDQRVAEPVELRLRLALRRLDHQRARHRERHRRRMEAVVHQALRDVLDLDAAPTP